MADNKIILREIVAELARRSNIDDTQADAFVKAFIETIMEGLRRDMIVKIKGFGTFKLVSVEDRESINVNTGERFMIEGHSKVSFTPDAALRDEINKPFADFQTVILNDGVDISGIGKEIEIEEPITEPVTNPVAEPEQEQKTEQEQKNEQELETEQGPESNQELESELEQAPEQETMPELPQTSEPVVTKDDRVIIYDTPQTASEKKTRKRIIKRKITINNKAMDEYEYDPNFAPEKENATTYRILAVICVILLCVVSYTAGYYRWFAQTDPLLQPHRMVAPAEKNAKPQEQAKAEEAKDSAAQYPQLKGGEYLIVGVKGTHKLESGQSLQQLAAKYYGDKKFSKYIVVLNNIADPNLVRIGMVLKLPELKKAEE